ncbi:MAG: hypothetical protein Q9211_002919 [Gyalolechia sp. 1 TL-2023]
MFKHIPWASHEDGNSSETKTQEKEESLTTILNIDQRGDLTLLIASIMASMRKAIEMNFDANPLKMRRSPVQIPTLQPQTSASWIRRRDSRSNGTRN